MSKSYAKKKPANTQKTPKWVKSRGCDAETTILISQQISPAIWTAYPDNGDSMTSFTLFICECVRAFQILHPTDKAWHDGNYWDAVDGFCDAVKALWDNDYVYKKADEIAEDVFRHLSGEKFKKAPPRHKPTITQFVIHKNTPTLLSPAKPNDLWHIDNLPFYRQQLDLWLDYICGTGTTLEAIGTDGGEIQRCFDNHETPHDVVEWMISKDWLNRDDGWSMSAKKRPECPYQIQ